MTKQEEFLWIVQTAILANGINLSANPDSREEYRDTYSSLVYASSFAKPLEPAL